jgi:uncharacterized membrane protein YccC
MSDTIVTAVLTGIGTALATILTFLLKRRSASGTVQTSDAQTLWKEATVYRQALTDRLAESERENVRLDAALAKAHARNMALERALRRAQDDEERR